MSTPAFRIQLTQQAKQSLTKIKDKRHQQLIIERIEQLQNEPEKQGKALTQPLKGYRSIRAVGQRYRIVYKVEKQEISVIVVGLGLRKEGSKKDVYVVLQRLLERNE